ncbi:MAG TPA: MoaD/ThiS family protein [Candidatus Baltobacteraceae bacterium]|nr:MoaD/ThiS family protein [Candidatus Baltobacteraceae bacterium]
MTVRVLAFARLRELLGFGARDVDVPAGADLEALWSLLARGAGDLAPLRASTRFARNGRLVGADTALADGDEVALMPPVGGG